jgi:AcrR family transcriptional regulator
MAAIAKPFSPEAALKRSLRAHLHQLGFTKSKDGDLLLPGMDKDVIRRMHREQRRERLTAAQPFLAQGLERALPHFANGAEIDPSQIRLRLRLVKSDTEESDLFRVATLTWSVPVSVGFGRRMRYLVWDDAHDRLAGVIALGDPVYNLSVRDSLIGWSVDDRAKRLVGILDAYVLGAVPPYNFLLGGKAVACLVRSRDVFEDFRRLYGQSVGVISQEAKKAQLVAVTTSSSMGRSSVYNRLRLGGTAYFERIGFTEGWGHFHITDALFEKMRHFLRERDHRYADKHKFGEGPNWRLRTIRAALSALDLDANILRHGIKREVFISKLATNAYDVLRTGLQAPDTSHLLTVADISELARDRWIVPRATRGAIDYRAWQRDMIPHLINGSIETVRAADRLAG